MFIQREMKKAGEDMGRRGENERDRDEGKGQVHPSSKGVKDRRGGEGTVLLRTSASKEREGVRGLERFRGRERGRERSV